MAVIGLGLSIFKRLVDLVNGSLKMFGEPGPANSLVFSLPFEYVSVQSRRRWALPLLSVTIYVKSSVHKLAEHNAGWSRL